MIAQFAHKQLVRRNLQIGKLVTNLPSAASEVGSQLLEINSLEYVNRISRRGAATGSTVCVRAM